MKFFLKKSFIPTTTPRPAMDGMLVALRLLCASNSKIQNFSEKYFLPLRAEKCGL
jgi:hypothetical protein